MSFPLSPSARDPWLRAVAAGALFWGVVVVVLKLNQHAAFQTQAYDLGLFSNVIWNTSRGLWYLNGLRGTCVLGDHFSPLLAALAPCFWIWEDARVLLVVQSVALAAALPAAYLLGRRSTGRAGGGVLLAVWLAFLPFLHRVSAYDFHETALGIPIILWMLVAREQGRDRAFWTLAAALVLLREDYGLSLAGLGVAWLLAEGPGARQTAWALAIGGIVWTAVVLLGVMPLFRGGGQSLAFSYGNLGRTPAEVATAFLKPSVWRALSPGWGIRGGSLLVVLAWTGGAALFAPRLAPAWLVPLALQLVSGREGQVRLQAHYSAVVIPFLVYAAARGLGVLSSRPWMVPRRDRIFVLLGGAAVAGGLFFMPRYYRRPPPERAGAAIALRRVPAEASVQASADLLPHLCLRRTILLAPDPRRTEWVALDRAPFGFLPPPGLAATLDRFAERNAASRVYAEGGIELYHFPPPETPS
jgi:hypothetical protein